MKISIINHNDKCKGTYYRCLAIGSHFSDLKNDVDLSCLSSGARKTLAVNHGRRVDGVNIITLASQHGNTSISELPFHILRSFQNIHLVLRRKYDVIMISGIASPTTGLTLLIAWSLKKAKLIKGTIIVDWDDLWGRGGLTSINNKGRLTVVVADFMEKRLPGLADMVTVVSQNIKKRALQAGIDPKRIFYLPNGTSSTKNNNYDLAGVRKKLGISQDTWVLIFVGRALWTFDYLLESFKRVIKKHPSTKILYISPLSTKHLEIIKKAGLESNIIFLGTLSYENLLKLVSISDIALLPRSDSDIERANFPARLCDFLSMGKPVVSSSIGDEVEYIIKKYKCGLLADPLSSGDYANKIVSLIENKPLIKKLSSNSLLAAKELSLDKYISKLNKIIS